MVPLREIASSLYGAYRFAFFDTGAGVWFNSSIDGFWRSFFAGVMVAPMFIVLLYVEYAVAAEPPSGARFVFVWAVAYVMMWVAFPLMMVAVARILNREANYFGYIAAFNWSLVIQNVIYLPFAIAITLGAATIDETIALSAASALGFVVIASYVVLVILVVYSWFIAKTMLDIRGGQAAGVALVDILLTIIISRAASILLMAG